MRRRIPLAIALAIGGVIAFDISQVHPAGEVVGQRFFQFGINDIKGTFSNTESRYIITGVYAVGEDLNYSEPFDPNKKKVLDFFEWKAEGKYNLATKVTEEKFDLFSTSLRSLAGSFTSNMVCVRDPWREEAPGGPCQFVDTKASGKPPPVFVSDLSTTAQGVPFSSVLTPSERVKLNQQYQIFLARSQQREPGAPPGTVERYLQTAPTIVTPTINGYMVYKKSKFTIRPAQNFNGSQILVQFTRLNAPAGQLNETFAWTMQTAILAQGADIPNEIFGTRTGPWKVRARIDAPKAGDFSAEVPFQYVMQSPAVTTKPKGSFDLQGR